MRRGKQQEGDATFSVQSRRLIVVAEQRARQSGHRLVIVRGPPWVQRLFEVTGIDKWLDVRSDPSDLFGSR